MLRALEKDHAYLLTKGAEQKKSKRVRRLTKEREGMDHRGEKTKTKKKKGNAKFLEILTVIFLLKILMKRKQN